MYTRYVTTQPTHTARPVKFKGHLIPEYFNAYFYVLDNDGVKVTPKNLANFKNTWVIELLLRVTKLETIDVIQLQVKGAKPFTGHQVFSTKPFDPTDLGTIHARHFNLLQEHRARLMSVAVQVAIQSHKYKKQTVDRQRKWDTNGPEISGDYRQVE